MEKQNYNIPELITKIGVGMNYQPGAAYALQRLMTSANKVDYKDALKEVTDLVNGYDSQKDYGDSSNLLGVPLFQPLTLSVDGEEDLFLESAVIDLTMPRNIVETVIDGRDSSVKEFINNGDYEISCSGVICNNDYAYPMDQVVDFMNMMRQKSTLEVTHEVLNALGIYEIVVMQPTLQKTTYINCQQYSFTAKSDVPLELNVNELSSLTQ